MGLRRAYALSSTLGRPGRVADVIGISRIFEAPGRRTSA
jgi:hypothetical protein